MSTTPENPDSPEASQADRSSLDLSEVDLSDAAERARAHAQLTERIEEYRAAYYQDSLLVSDAEYDELVGRLQELATEYPGLLTDADGRRHRRHLDVRPGRAHRSDVQPRQRLRLRGAEDLVRTCAFGHLGAVEVPVRTQDRRARRQPALPQRGPGPRRHPRR